MPDGEENVRSLVSTGQLKIEDALSVVGVGRHQFYLFVYVGACWMSDAMEVMLVAVLAPAVGCEWGTSPEGQSLLASAVFIGMMLASSGWGLVADIAGRKVAFGAAAALAAFTGLASSLAPSFGWLVVLRLLVGCGLVGVLPMYTLLEEWLPRDSGSKGKWLVAMQAWWSVGTVFEALLARWLLNSYGWRILLMASCFPIACVLMALPLIPESPHYLADNGRTEDAQRVLSLAAARNGTIEALRCHLRQQQQRERERGPTSQHQETLQRGPTSQHQETLQPLLLRAEAPQPLMGIQRRAADSRVDGSSATGASAGALLSETSHLGIDARAVPGGAAAVAAEGADTGSTDRADGVNAHDGDMLCSECCDSCGRASCSKCSGAYAVLTACTLPCGGGGRAWKAVRLLAGADTRHCGSGGGGGGGWCAEAAGLARVMLGPQLIGRTWRLAVTWFACALSYYGVVMLVPYIAAGGVRHDSAGTDGNGGGSCVPWRVDDGDAAAAAVAAGGVTGRVTGGAGSSHLLLPPRAFYSMMVAATAELPSLAWAFLVVDRWSKRRTVALSLAATAGALAPLVMALAGGAGVRSSAATIASRAPPAAPPPPLWRRRRLQPGWLSAGTRASEWLPLASITLARLFVSGAFTLLYILTPEQYPSYVHGSALGAANTLARVGALAAPFLAVALPLRGELPEALGLMVAVCVAAALAAGGLPDALKTDG